MVGIHVLDRALLRLDQSARVGDRREELLRLQIDDPAEARDQMGRGWADHDKEEILKLYKGLSRGMGAEIASAYDGEFVSVRLVRMPRDHDPRALQRIARGALVQHQRDPVVG